MRKATSTSSLFVAAAVASIVSSTYAQPRIEVGGYGGGTSTTMHQTFDCPPPSSLTDVCVTGGQPHEGAHGVSVGAYGRCRVLPGLLVEANLMYARKGYDVSPRVRMHYLEAPIMARVDPFAGRSHARVFAYAGLAPALHLWCHASGTRFDNEIHDAVPYSDSCGYWPFYPRAPNRIDLGGVIGGGIGWELSFGVIELHARYIEGLIGNEVWDGGKTVNKAFYVFAGYGRTIGTP